MPPLRSRFMFCAVAVDATYTLFLSIGRQGVRHSLVLQIFVHRSLRNSMSLPKNRVFIDACVFSLISRCTLRTTEITNDLRTQYFFLSLRFFNYCSNKLTKNNWDQRESVFSSKLTFKSWMNALLLPMRLYWSHLELFIGEILHPNRNITVTLQKIKENMIIFYSIKCLFFKKIFCLFS